MYKHFMSFSQFHNCIQKVMNKFQIKKSKVRTQVICANELSKSAQKYIVCEDLYK